ncbi:hypothetical protein [Pseudophaeobacter sp. TrK17]|uniref:hypothetical protein n=1 Tax=Pseudophaeobacter sp. TrK17 TaxID=2815167 RepID=UPI0035D022A6
MMAEFSGKSIVVFCPRFFDYDVRIKDKLLEMGADVQLFDERPSNQAIIKAIIRLRVLPLMRPLVTHYYTRVIKSLSGRKADHLLIINPECVTPGILRNLRTALGAPITTVYMWDSLRNKPAARELIPEADAFFTFDAADSASDDRLRYLALFSAFSGSDERKQIPVDISFFGTLHSDRYAVCKAVQKRAEQIGLTTRFFFYAPSRIYFFLRWVFDAGFRRVNFNDLSFAPLPLSEIEKEMRASKAVLDIQHPGQVGLTMRTIEALDVGCKLITTNPEVSKHAFFRPSNVLIIDRYRPELDEGFFLAPYEPLPIETVDRYSIANWLRAILAIEKARDGVDT